LTVCCAHILVVCCALCAHFWLCVAARFCVCAWCIPCDQPIWWKSTWSTL